MPEASLYGCWDFGCTIAAPAHTYLYRVPALGVGSAFVESLTGYIARLAEAHTVSVGTLFTRELLPRIRQVTATAAHADRAHNAFMYKVRTLNEAGKGSDKIIALLESLTDLQNLNLLTLLPWISVISRQHLLKATKAWCPVCLKQWHDSGNVMYDPLLWTINCVTHCPVHRCRLSSSCPQCGKSLHTLSARSRPGICYCCHTWLGAPASAYADEHAGMLIARWVAELLAATHEPGKGLSENVFRSNLNTCIERVSDGNASRFCAVTGVSFDSVLNWRSGNGQIRLGVVLKLCIELGFSPLAFLTDVLEQSDVERAAVMTRAKPERVRRRRSRAQVDAHLAHALQTDTPVSLRELADRLGYAKVQCLTNRNPDTCAEVRKRYNAAKVRTPIKRLEHAPADEVIRLALVKALEASPRVPVKTVAHSLGFKNEFSLYERFPQLCRAFALANKRDREQRLDRMRAECVSALLQIPPPTAREVAAKIGCSMAALQYRFPDLYTEVVKRLPDRKQMLRDEIRRSIELALTEDPPPSMEMVGDRVGRTASYLCDLYPDLTWQIRTRYRAQQQADSAERYARFRDQIRITANDLRARGMTPSRSKILAAIPKPMMNCHHIVDAQIVKIVRELEDDQV